MIIDTTKLTGQPPVDAGKRRSLADADIIVARGPFGATVDRVIAKPEVSDDDFDYQEFVSENFWKAAANSKRKIKALRKQIAAEERVLREAEHALSRFFSDCASDLLRTPTKEDK